MKTKAQIHINKSNKWQSAIEVLDMSAHLALFFWNSMMAYHWIISAVYLDAHSSFFIALQ